jgi:hypothetical protein
MSMISEKLSIKKSLGPHFLKNDLWIAEAKKHGYDGLFGADIINGQKIYQPGVAFVEAKNYRLGLEQGVNFGYSERTMNYLQSQLNKMPWVIRAEIGVFY